MKTIKLPKPECKSGYPKKQLEEILGTRYDDFCHYMTGQTCMLCENKIWNPDKKIYEADNCGPHGIVTYKCDVMTFLEGRPTLD